MWCPPRQSWYRGPLISLWQASGLDMRVLLAAAMAIEWITGGKRHDILYENEKRRMRYMADILFILGSAIFVASSVLNLMAGRGD